MAAAARSPWSSVWRRIRSTASRCQLSSSSSLNPPPSPAALALPFAGADHRKLILGCRWIKAAVLSLELTQLKYLVGSSQPFTIVFRS